MLRFKTLAMMFLALLLCSSTLCAATFTECYKDTCAMITVPDSVMPDEDFEVKVEGYIEGASSWDTSAYMLFENAEWHYNDFNMVLTDAPKLDERGFNWGGSFSKTYIFNNPPGDYVLTFVFGSRGWSHGYYDVAVEARFSTSRTALPVAFDIKPQSCPNPINDKRKGVLSAAIVGSAEFDVTRVDPATIKVAGLSPIHYAYEDVTEPYYPLTGKSTDLDCVDAGPDGFLDLTLKFRAQDFYNALQDIKGHPLQRGDSVMAELSAGLLVDGLDSGVLLVGEDVVRILGKQ